jgi:predicted dehydrogenase
MARRLTRRRFLQTSAAAGVVSFWPGGIRAADDKKPAASERLQIAVIGTTGQGQSDWSALVSGGAEVAAYSDVDERKIGAIQSKFPKANFFVDYRKMLEQKGLDGILVATPDHVHAPATLAALHAGLHVFCEKPLTHTVEEARLVAETAAKHKRVTQMGTQIHAGDNYRKVVEIIQSGAIGTIREVHTWCGANYGGKHRPKESEPVPDGFHWDLWLGPAPVRPFYHGADSDKRGIYHPFNWRNWWDFGGGSLADMACHHMDLPFWALGLRHPTKVSAEGPAVDPESPPQTLIVTYEFPAREKLPPVTLKWYHGGKRPPHFAEGKLPKWGDGSLFVGDKGQMLAGYGDFKLLPAKDFVDYQLPKPTIPRSIGHYKEWVEACKNNGPTTCNFDYAGALTEAVLLGNVAFRCGKALEWNPKELKATNAPEADKFIRKEYRKGWEIKG